MTTSSRGPEEASCPVLRSDPHSFPLLDSLALLCFRLPSGHCSSSAGCRRPGSLSLSSIEEAMDARHMLCTHARDSACPVPSLQAPFQESFLETPRPGRQGGSPGPAFLPTLLALPVSLLLMVLT